MKERTKIEIWKTGRKEKREEWKEEKREGRMEEWKEEYKEGRMEKWNEV